MKTNPHIYSHKLIQKSELKTFENIDSFEIMKKAAQKSFEYINRNVKFKKILIICGPGNNGGDGILIAKNFTNIKKNIVIFAPLQLGKTKDSQKALNELKNKKLIKEKINLNDYDLIIDSLFGIGFNRNLSGDLNDFFKKINHSKKYVIAIDMPSGVFTDTGRVSSIAIKANITLTFHRLKPGLLLMPGKLFSGNIEVFDIGLVDLDNETRTHILKPPLLKRIQVNTHKYNRGTTFVIAGRELIGASKLAALSASKASLRVGGGVAKIFVHKDDINFFKPHILEEMIIPFKNSDHLINIIQKNNVCSLIFGCGMDVNSSNREILDFLLKQSFRIVLDASAFSLINQDKNYFFKLLFNRKEDTILTPHSGEFEKIFSLENGKIESALKASRQTNSIILYKGNDTVISSPNGEIFINYCTSPYLATAGSGDVLAGMIGGFLSQEYNGVEATLIACYVHSQCGIKLNKGLIASDLIGEIPEVLKDLN